MNICEHLSDTARIFPDRTAIRFEDESISYARLDGMSAAAAAIIRDAGVKRGDRVALVLPNVPAFAVWYYAALRVGSVAVSISTRSVPSEIAWFTGDCEARFFVSDGNTSRRVLEDMPDCVACSVVTNELGDSANGSAIPFPDGEPVDTVKTSPGDPATILYTSGTTGFAKGATLSHLNVRSNVCAFNHLCNMKADDRILLAVPLFHCFGQNALLNSALNVGATLVLQRKFDLNESKRLIAEERVTQVYGVPMMFQLLLGSCEPDGLASVDYCFSAAATLPVQVGQRWQEKFGLPIHEGYGLTETSPFASYNHRSRFVPGSIGTPIDCVEMKIVDTETGDECPAGEPGEIIIRGPNVMLGYWNREEDTRTVICDGWFHSGDIGRRDEDGYFYIVDRVKDMIAVGGLKVFPAEVERVLHDHPAVTQVAVVGIPDEVFGEQVVAFVVLVETDSPDVVTSIAQYAKDHLANYKTPRMIVPIPELPRNPSGKILKRQLREFDLSKHLTEVRLHSRMSEAAGTALRPLGEPTLRLQLEQTHTSSRLLAATAFIQDLVRTIADLEDIEADAGFFDAGLDSLMMVEIGNQLKVELGPDHEIPATLVFDYPRVCDLAEYLVQALIPESPQETPAESQPEGQALVDTNATALRSEIESMSEDEALAELMKELND